jgi:DNA-binding CsgD family transcriptional regulator
VPILPPVVLTVARRVHGLLLAPRAGDEEDRRRELALNSLLLTSVLLAVMAGAQRVVEIGGGGPDTADHAQTLVVVAVAGLACSALLWLSRRGRPVTAAWGLLSIYYLLAAWLLASEGPQKGLSILACSLLVVTAGVLCGSRPALTVAAGAAVTLTIVVVLESTHVLGAPPEAVSQIPDTGTVIEMAVAFGAIALLVSTRTRARTASVADVVGGGSPASPLHDLRTGALSVRELQVVRLVAAGRGNSDIAAELMVSLRTVHSHVSSALRKTGCANRTELAVLAIREGVAEAAPDRHEE